MLLQDDLARAFHPASIAIVGVSDSSKRRFAGPYGGFTTLCNLLDLGFEGRIYPINPNTDKILGLKAYPSVCAVPETVDLVIVCVPAKHVPCVLQDCAEAKALNVHVMTSGFGETAQEEGREIQENVQQIALKGGLHIIGPNCMGLQVPSSRISTFEIRPQCSGPVALVSQSGSVVFQMMQRAPASGIGFSKVISCGNSLILDPTDFVEYLATDAETGIICMYVEGVKDGKRLLQIVRRTNPSKPVIVWKVGLNDSSARAALSHTGLLGGKRNVWDAFFKQTGVVRVRSLEELSDSIMTFLYMKPPKGRGAAVLTAGGGVTVAAAETCTEAGLHLPALTGETEQKLLNIVSLVNQGIANPLDIADLVVKPDLVRQLLTILAEDPSIDFLISDCLTLALKNPELASKFATSICEFIEGNRSNKPLAISINSQWGNFPEESKGPWVQQLLRAGVPVYDSLDRACRALAAFIDYHKRVATDQPVTVNTAADSKCYLPSPSLKVTIR